MSPVSATSGSSSGTDPLWGAAQATPTQAPAGPATDVPPGGKMGKDEFLKLLVTQLQNQDPMNPSQPEQMASQLAQFSSVEQLTNLNETLTNQSALLTSMIGGIGAGSALGALGRTVVASGHDVMVEKDATSSVSFDLRSPTIKGTLHVLDESGNEVYSQDLGAMSAGRQTVQLDPKDPLDPGHYTYTVDATDAAGGAVGVTTYTAGKIDGVRFDSTGPIFTVGSIEIPMSAVVQIAN